MTGWRSPQVLVGGAAIFVMIVLFFADKLVAREELAEGLRNALDIAGQAAPWVIAAVLALVVLYMFRLVRRLTSRLNAVEKGKGEAEEQSRQLEAALKKAKEELAVASSRSREASTSPARRNWASISKGGVVRITVPNSDLENMYDRSMAALSERGLQAWLWWLEVRAFPHSGRPNEVKKVVRVIVDLSFYSPQSGRQYSFSMQDDGELCEEPIAKLTTKPSPMFRELPWREYPEWSKMANVAAERAGPLVPDPMATVAIMTISGDGPLRWSGYVDDCGAGRRLDFEGSSATDMQETTL